MFSGSTVVATTDYSVLVGLAFIREQGAEYLDQVAAGVLCS